MSTPDDGRTGMTPGPAVAALREVTDAAVDVARRWRDPAAKLRRKKRRARRRAGFFGMTAGTWGIGTATLVAASAPEWTVVATGGATAVFAVPAIFALRTFRRLDAVPLPPASPARRSLPPPGSVARAAMQRLSSNEQGLERLLAVVSKSGAVAGDDLEEIGEAARSASSALDSVVEDIVALESAARASEAAGVHLGPAITAAGQRLDSGVDQYEQLVSAAAKLAAAPEGTRSMAFLDRQRTELIDASERLESWAQSWREIEQIQERHRH
ncbi:hypothetical protein HCA61_13950 [Rhodococcus sp. HNM0563]|uniref:phage shock envelope stress response protein PspM n=1 Tax=unclassified Rhodococcus (in: high G+C Gram-positive bacteria) TaxID=192944 RepID=UPI00146D1412|nr:MULTISPECIES: hypothetical protein [unclassified Rhodococcus (in: high G+C Gram-positive bacteria)]MCK0092149.1 hypothetical protein [Rhodococcus sp. F64268]NLU63365.1 hypothetical protein [Rhodococcus sp. HNM0563]